MPDGGAWRFREGVDPQGGLTADNVNSLDAGGNVYRTWGQRLQVDVSPLYYWTAPGGLTALTVYAGAVGQSVPAAATSYVYLDSANALVINQSGFPSYAVEAHVPLAVVVTDTVQIVSIDDRRPRIIRPGDFGGGGGGGSVGVGRYETSAVQTVPHAIQTRLDFGLQQNDTLSKGVITTGPSWNYQALQDVYVLLSTNLSGAGAYTFPADNGLFILQAFVNGAHSRVVGRWQSISGTFIPVVGPGSGVVRVPSGQQLDFRMTANTGGFSTDWVGRVDLVELP